MVTYSDISSGGEGNETGASPDSIDVLLKELGRQGGGASSDSLNELEDMEGGASSDSFDELFNELEGTEEGGASPDSLDILLKELEGTERVNQSSDSFDELLKELEGTEEGELHQTLSTYSSKEQKVQRG